MTKLIVSEMFGPTIQGEGPAQGRRAFFVRLGLCNLDCRWCDTPYTWDWTGKNGPPQDRNVLIHMEPVTVRRWINERANADDIIVITGGEPLVQSSALAHLLADYSDQDDVDRWWPEVHIETNGTIEPRTNMNYGVRQWVVSLKLPSSGVARDDAVKPNAIRKFLLLDAAWKFVVADDIDVKAAVNIVEQFRLPRRNVWLMPEGRTAIDVVRRSTYVMDAAVEHGFNMSSRLHVLAYDDKRGV